MRQFSGCIPGAVGDHSYWCSKQEKIAKKKAPSCPNPTAVLARWRNIIVSLHPNLATLQSPFATKQKPFATLQNYSAVLQRIFAALHPFNSKRAILSTTSNASSQSKRKDSLPPVNNLLSKLLHTLLRETRASLRHPEFIVPHNPSLREAIMQHCKHLPERLFLRHRAVILIGPPAPIRHRRVGQRTRPYQPPLEGRPTPQPKVAGSL